MSEFDAWAPYYDLIHQGLPGEAQYYVEEALRQGGETLELGCGTGRICIPMAMSGVRVTGLDNSPRMLQLCRVRMKKAGKLPGKLTLVRADMRAFDLGRHFQFIAMPYRAFMHLLTPKDQIACLHCVRRHLARHGVFILNVWAARPSTIAHAAKAKEKFLLAGRYPAPWGKTRLLHHHTAHYDEYLQRITESHRIREVDHHGRLLHEETLSLTRAWLTPREMEHLLHRCGFCAEAVLGGFDGIPLNAGSTEMIWRLRLPRSRNTTK